MNDAEYEHHKGRILGIADWWIPRIGLGWWNISMAYARGDFAINNEPAPGTVAHTSANWRYGHACITWNMQEVATMADWDLEKAVVHELMHVFLHEARDNGDDWLDHEERVASSLAKGFLWLRDTVGGGGWSSRYDPDRHSDVAHSATPPTPEEHTVATRNQTTDA